MIRFRPAQKAGPTKPPLGGDYDVYVYTDRLTIPGVVSFLVVRIIS